MPNKLFDNTFLRFKDTLIGSKTAGVMDLRGAIVSSTDNAMVGTRNFEASEFLDEKQDTQKYKGFTYSPIKEKGGIGYWVFCNGEDKQTKDCAELLSYHFADLKRLYDEKYDKNGFIKNIITDNILPGDSLYKSRELQINPNISRIILLIRPGSESEIPVIDVLKAMFPDQEKDFIVPIDSRNIALVKELGTITDPETIDKFVMTVADTLSQECMIKINISVSNVADNISKLSVAYMECRIALEVGKVFDDDRGIIYYSRLGIGRLIYQLPLTLCKLFLDEVFKKDPIDTLDEETLHTIYKFFDNNLNISETARKLFIHRNTLVYRMDKVKKLTGLDVREFDDAVVFKIALMVDRYLKSKPARA
jgi:carbohydrate diacid regulator